MAEFLFLMFIVSTVGMFVFPILSPSRGRAILGWFGQLCGSTFFSLTLRASFPSWIAPRWSASLAWVLVEWVLFVAGLVIAIRKPRKRNVIVA